MVSVIVITYNRSVLLVKTLESILKQTYNDFEIIVIDDGSKDNTKSEIKSLNDKRIRYFNFGKIGNLSKLRNLGIKKSEKKFIAFCDDDDVWFKNKLEVQVNLSKDYKLLCSNAEVIDENDNITESKYFGSFGNDFIITKEHLLKHGNSILTSALFLERKILTENELYFDEVNVTNYCEDYELFLRISKFGDFLFIGENLIKKRQHSSVSGGLDNNIIMLNSSINILEEFSKKDGKQSEINSIEGILGFKILLTKLSFKINFHSGLSEVFNFIKYLTKPNVFNLFIKTKVVKKAEKILNS